MNKVRLSLVVALATFCGVSLQIVAHAGIDEAPTTFGFDREFVAGAQIVSSTSGLDQPFTSARIHNTDNKEIAAIRFVVDYRRISLDQEIVPRSEGQWMAAAVPPQGVVEISRPLGSVKLRSYRGRAFELRLLNVKFSDGSIASGQSGESTAVDRVGNRVPCSPVSLSGDSRSGRTSGTTTEFECYDTEYALYCWNYGTSCTTELCWTGASAGSSMCHFKKCGIAPASGK